MSRKKTEQRKYTWKIDFFNHDPNEVAHRVYDLETKLGHFPTPDEIEADANIAASPFSTLLMVDEDDAKRIWRRRRIRAIFHNLRIEKNGKPSGTKAFYLVQPNANDKRRYVPGAYALRSHPMRQQIFLQAKLSYDRFFKRFAADRSLRSLRPLIDKLREEFEKETLAGIGG